MSKLFQIPLNLNRITVTAKKSFRNDQFLFIAFLILLFILSISLMNPAGTFFESWDFLDSMFGYQYLRAKHVSFFEFGSVIPEVLGGLQIDALGISDLGFESLSYRLFDPFTANALIEALTRILAFMGFCLLIRKLKYLNDSRGVLSGISALTFALIPWHPHLGMTIALQPLFIAILFSNIKTRFVLKTFIIFILTQNISFALGGFVDLLIFLVILILLRKNQLSMFRYLVLFCTCLFGFLIANIRLVHLLFFTNFQSHRVDWVKDDHLLELSKFPQFSVEFWTAITQGIPHIGNPQSIRFFIPLSKDWEFWYFGVGVVGFSISLVFIASVFAWLRSVRSGADGLDRNFPPLFLPLIFSQLGLIAFYISESSGMTNFKYISEVPWQVSRVAIIVPTLTCVVFAISISEILRMISSKPIILASVFLICTIIVQACYVYFPLNGRIRESIDFSPPQNISAYYQQSTYQQIKKLVSNEADMTPGVLSYGLDPMIASFNGLMSIDGYSSNYSREYKKKFRNIIQEQLEMNVEWRQYYDMWGSRAYLFYQGENPSIDWCAAASMDARFLLSKVRITTADLVFMEKVDTIFVYRLTGC